MKRGCLVGLGLDAQTTRAAATLIAALPAVGGARRIRIVEPRDLHLTLRYLGDVEDAAWQALRARLPEVAERYPLAPVLVRGLGAAPTIARPRIVLASVPGPRAQLARLQAQVDAVCLELGFASLPRPWRAHVSLARIEEAVPDGPISTLVRRRRSLEFGHADTSRLILYQRKESKSGTHLVPAAHWTLGS